MPFRKQSKKESRKASSKYEGQLAVDVYQTEDAIVIKAPIAGVQLSDINIAVTDDVITIKGERKQESDVDGRDYLAQECYWGAFSRSIILPGGVDKDQIKAKFKEGILTIKLPKGAPEKSVKVEE